MSAVAHVTFGTTDPRPNGVHAVVQQYIQAGFVVFPIPYGSKKAALLDWQHPDRRWRAEDFAPRQNVAMRLDGLTDVDADCREARLACTYLFQSTAHHGRKRGGLAGHYLYHGETTPAQYRDVNPDGSQGAMLIEVRSGHTQYTCAPPSYYDGDDADEIVWMSSDTSLRTCAPDKLLLRVKVAATIALVARHYPSRGSRHALAGHLAGLLCRLLDKDEYVAEIVRIAATVAGDDEVEDRRTYAQNTLSKYRAGIPVTGGPTLSDLLGRHVVQRLCTFWGKTDVAQIENLNAQHAVLFGQHGKVVVLSEMDDGLRYSSPSEMALLYPTPVVVGDRARKPLGAYWVTHPDRRFYRGIELAPKGGRADYYNLWRGFSVEPKRGDWSLFQEQIELLANGYDGYIYEWMAHTVQHPDVPIGIVLAFKGEQGTGKSTFGKWFGALFGCHFIHIDSDKHLLGHFNAHLADKIIVLADEAVWAGGKAGLGALKRMITEETLTIERKGGGGNEWVAVSETRFPCFDFEVGKVG